jgi:hypothetical protein
MPETCALRKLQFRVLYRVFLLRVVDLELLSADGDTTRLLGQFAALFAAISFMFTAPLILFGGGLPPDDILTMEHFLISTTMVVIGLFSVLNWDSIFPDRRDVLVLAPLPVRANTLFLAKMASLAFAMALSVIALNVFTGLVWPAVIFAPHAGVVAACRSVAAYWITISAAATFIFCSVLAVQGMTALLLPRQQFLRLSALLQVAAFCLFVGVYILEPSLQDPTLLATPENQRVLIWLPTYWFFGLFQQLNGSMLSGLAPLASRAWIALAIAAFAAGATVLLSFRYTLRKTVEEPDILPSAGKIAWPQSFGSSLQSAVLLFTTRTLLRSRQHRVILSFYLGIGFAVALAYIKFPLGQHGLSRVVATGQAVVPFFVASILMMCVAVAGVRVVFPLPIALRANWIFRLTELRPASEYSIAVRRSLFMLSVVPVWFATGGLFFCIFPPRIVAEHLLVLGLIGAILVELSMHGFQKVPFTCSYLPGKGNLQYAFWGCLLLVLPLINAGAKLEEQMLHSPVGYISIILVLGIVATLARWRSSVVARPILGMQFDEAMPPDIFALKLHRN